MKAFQSSSYSYLTELSFDFSITGYFWSELSVTGRRLIFITPSHNLSHRRMKPRPPVTFAEARTFADFLLGLMSSSYRVPQVAATAKCQ